MDRNDQRIQSKTLISESGSFRDRQNQVVYYGHAVYRLLDQDALADWHAASSTEFFSRFGQQQKIIETTEITDLPRLPDDLETTRWAGVLEHRRIPFVTYPYEWSFGMLRDAARLTIDIQQHALDEGMILKDASAFNVQFVGPNPVFIDVPSIQRQTPGEPWRGYRQFCEMFLNPLMLQAYKDVGFHPWLRGHVDGIPIEEFANLISTRDLARAGVIKHVYLQSKLQSGYADSEQDVKAELRSSGFNIEMIKTNVRGLAKLVDRLTWKRAGSQWSDYTDTHSYNAEDYQRKKEFVREAAQEHHRQLVWDLGSNTGDFSRIAAESAGYVVAMDSDHLAVERMYIALKHEGYRNILPIVANIVDPTPSLGWRLSERKSLFQRGTPDLTLALALVHHVVIGSNVPMREFVDWLADLNSDLVIEFVTRDDPMVKTLLRNKDDVYSDYTLEWFEHCLEANFTNIRREDLGSGSRILYRVEPRLAEETRPQTESA